jgi:3-oxoacyl-(acyl-carrier-protein) synthase
MQILSLLAVEKAVKNYNILLRGNEDDVKVLSGSCTGLDLLNNSGYRIKAHELGKVKGVSKEDVKNIQDLLAKKYGITSIREDMSFGQLNNVLADRVSNFFNFRGKNCNIDSDFNSLSLAIDTALREIVFEEGVVIVVSPYENFSKNMTLINRGKMRCYIFSSLEYAKSHNYPILFENVSSTYKSSSQ